MKTRYYLLFYIFIICTSCKRDCNYIDDYYPEVYRGTLAYEEGRYQEAYIHYNKAFTKCAARNTQTIYEIDLMARVAAILGKDKVCYDMIEKQISDGFTISKYTSDSTFNSFFSKKLGKKLLQNSEKLRNEYISSIDTLLYNSLVEMSCSAQKFRGTTEQIDLDSINERKLISFFENDRFPKESLLRYKNDNFIDIHTILLHTRDSIRINYFLPKIKELIKNGKCDPYLYASLFDQYYFYNGMPRIYGTYKRRDGVLSDHIELKEIDKNRLMIGMMTLEDEKMLHELKIQNYPESYGKFFTK